jgi:hypothetical protein
MTGVHNHSQPLVEVGSYKLFVSASLEPPGRYFLSNKDYRWPDLYKWLQLVKPNRKLEGNEVIGAIHQQIEMGAYWKEGKPKTSSTVSFWLICTHFCPFMNKNFQFHAPFPTGDIKSPKELCVLEGCCGCSLTPT